MKRAAEIAIEKARTAGVAWVGAQWSNHAGPASLYARMMLPHDMLGLYFAVGNANHLPPWGGLEMLLSTNPIAAAIPAGEEPPIVLDMATTVAAYGKVKAKAARGEMMPEGWMIDREGTAAHGSEARGRGLPAADRRLQGLRPGTRRGPHRGHAQRRGHGARRDRLQRRRRERHQHRAGDRRDRPRGVRRRGGVQGRGGQADPRPARLGAHAGRGAHLHAGRAEPREERRAAQGRHRPGAPSSCTLSTGSPSSSTSRRCAPTRRTAWHSMHRIALAALALAACRARRTPRPIPRGRSG